jgi:Fic family protein
MKKLLERVAHKKAELDALRPLPSALVKNLDEWFKIELTYSSNAIEGNTLTKSETAVVVEKGLTIAGKSVKEHLEAINLAHAIDFIKTLVTKKRANFTPQDLMNIHQLILKKIDDNNAGVWRKISIKISGSNAQLPDPIKIPELMDNFFEWLHTTHENAIIISADAHLKLVLIHPFVDGNDRTARLLMNILLMQTGYPPAIISPKDRIIYINAIEKAQEKNDFSDFQEFIAKAVEHSLDIYLDAAKKSI